MYNAFISYSHAADGRLAPALQLALEKFAKPWYRLRYLNIFRDEASLAVSPHLWTNIQAALQRSEYLVYMASPTSAGSKWINKEIEYWLANKPLEKLLIVLTDGEMLWDDTTNFFLNPTINSLPTSLENRFTAEPFYIDLRNMKTQADLSLNNPIFKKEVLKLAAQLHGKEPKDLAGEEVLAHNKIIRLRNTVITSLIFLLVAAVGAAWFANLKRLEAIDRTIEAKLSRARADSSAMIANLQRQIASEQRDSAIIARRLADSANIVAQLQKDTAQIERDNAIKQEKIALHEKDVAQANYFLSTAKTIAETNPTAGLRIAEAALLKYNDPVIEAGAYKIYRENSFYKIIARQPRQISALTISPDGTHILSVSKDSAARIWDMKGKLARVFKDPSQLVCAAYSPDGSYFVTGSRQGVARIWNVNGKLMHTLSGSAYITSVAFSPDGKFVLTGSVDSIARLWNMDGKTVHKFSGHQDQVTSVAFSPNGKMIVTGSYDQTIRTWDVSGKPLWQANNGAIVFSVAFSKDGRNLVSGDINKTAKLWDLQGKVITVFNGHSDAVIAAEFSPDGRFLLTSSWDRTAILWDLEGNIVEIFKGNTTTIDATFSKDGQYVVTGGRENVSLYADPDDYTIRLWQIRNSYTEISGNSALLSVCYSPGSNYVLAGALDHSLKLFDNNGNFIRQMNGHSGRIVCAAFSPNGSYLVSGSLDSTMKLWDMKGNLLKTLRGHTGFVNGVVFSPDGKFICTASEDHTVRLWNLQGEELQVFKHATAVRSVAFSPDGKSILTGTSAFGKLPASGL